MQRLRAMLRRRSDDIDPERLWVQYVAALGIVSCLFLGLYVVSSTLAERAESAARTMHAGAQIILLSQQVIEIAPLAAEMEEEAAVRLTALADEFKRMHLLFLAGAQRSEVLKDYLFTGFNPANDQIETFTNLASQLPTLRPELRADAVARLGGIYVTSGLQNALRTSVDIINVEYRQDIRWLENLMRGAVVIAAAVLGAIGFFVFLPAQNAVKFVIKELRSKTTVLCSSQKQLREMNDQLNHLVNHDPLTGLPNRVFMNDFINQMIEDAPRGEIGVLLVGLDGFKTVNDTIGHESGDLLLTSVASRLKGCVDDDDLVARIGGDEFFLTTTEPPEDVAKRLLATLEEPFRTNGRSVALAASIGYLTVNLAEIAPDQILGNATIAFHAAKTAGGRQATAYSPRLGEDAALMRQLQLELKDAIQAGQIEPWFQPQVVLGDGSLHGAEVLARWRHPTRGLLTPDKFLPAAERAGLIVELDHAVWRAAMACAVHWQATGVWRPCISINAAPDTIADPFLIEKLLKMIHQAELQTDQVVVEVLETTLIESADDMAAINIDGLAECGIALELDDFGTGYASLSKLTQLPLAGIKLDRSLIAPLPTSGADSVVRAILALAAELGFEVVAEGIEEREQADHLTLRGCAIGQGYGFSRPMPPDAFATWLVTHAHKKLVVGQAA